MRRSRLGAAPSFDLTGVRADGRIIKDEKYCAGRGGISMGKWPEKKPLITYRNVCDISTVLWFAGGLAMILGAYWLPLLFVGAVLFIFSFRVYAKYWRCPECDAQLPWRESHIRYCPNCGARLFL